MNWWRKFKTRVHLFLNGPFEPAYVPCRFWFKLKDTDCRGVLDGDQLIFGPLPYQYVFWVDLMFMNWCIASVPINELNPTVVVDRMLIHVKDFITAMEKRQIMWECIKDLEKKYTEHGGKR